MGTPSRAGNTEPERSRCFFIDNWLNSQLAGFTEFFRMMAPASCSEEFGDMAGVFRNNQALAFTR
jgi:hypothetical protein